MRLFVAITPPADVVAELHLRTSELRELAPGLRWSRPEQWHLTLAFLGEVSDETLPELTTRLGRAAGRHPPLALALSGGGRFGNRVLWTPVTGDRTGLGRLVDSVRAAVRRSGLPIEDRPYRPHLTLARSDGSTDLRPLVSALASVEGRQWVADRLHLVRSTLGAGLAGTALHEPVDGWALTG
jgi:2'-5' RNA ligase